MMETTCSAAFEQLYRHLFKEEDVFKSIRDEAAFYGCSLSKFCIDLLRARLVQAKDKKSARRIELSPERNFIAHCNEQECVVFHEQILQKLELVVQEIGVFYEFRKNEFLYHEQVAIRHVLYIYALYKKDLLTVPNVKRIYA